MSKMLQPGIDFDYSVLEKEYFAVDDNEVEAALGTSVYMAFANSSALSCHNQEVIQAWAEYLQVDPFTPEYKETDAYREWAKTFYSKSLERVGDKLRPTAVFSTPLRDEDLSEVLGLETSDPVESPSHYQIIPGLEVDHIQKALAKKYPDLDPYVAHRWMAAIEYLIRAPGKNWDEDFRKTAKLMDMILDYLEKDDA